MSNRSERISIQMEHFSSYRYVSFIPNFFVPKFFSYLEVIWKQSNEFHTNCVRMKQKKELHTLKLDTVLTCGRVMGREEDAVLTCGRVMGREEA